MAEFSRLIITKSGQALVSKVLSGAESKIRFTKVSASSAGYMPEQMEELAELDEVRQTASVSNVTYTDSMGVQVDATISNRDVTEGYYIRVLGLYALDPDIGEVLYAVTREMSGNCYMPSYNGTTVTSVYVQLTSAVGNSENVSLEVNPGAYASVLDVRELRKDLETMGETMEALNEGKLQSDGDIAQTTVTFGTNDEESLPDLQSGSKLSVLFGILAKAVIALRSHLLDKVCHVGTVEREKWSAAHEHAQQKSGNPHGVTKSDVGLGKVGNFKSVSTEAQTLTAAEKAQARANIGAGTSSFSGSYNDLSGKPAIPAAVRVKGNAESSYRTGDVNLTPANIGALALSGGTMTGSLAVDAGGGVTSVIGGGDVNLCADTFTVGPGRVVAKGGMTVQVLYVSQLNGLPYRPVVIGTSAPSDKTALWIDTST